jgi:hypothetical protein
VWKAHAAVRTVCIYVNIKGLVHVDGAADTRQVCSMYPLVRSLGGDPEPVCATWKEGKMTLKGITTTSVLSDNSIELNSWILIFMQMLKTFSECYTDLQFSRSGPVGHIMSQFSPIHILIHSFIKLILNLCRPFPTVSVI